MLRLYYSKVSYVLIFAFAFVLPICSQTRNDSTQADNTHNIKLRELVVPTVITGATAFFVDNGWLKQSRLNFQDKFASKEGRQTYIDDYLQYSPMLSVYCLNLVGVKGEHRFKERTAILAMSYATMGIMVNVMKRSFRESRPDSNARNSFPSGHTATVFMGAEFLRREYKDVSPWIGVAGYSVATATGLLRIYNNRHWINDVVAGAAIGILSTKLSYFLYPKIFNEKKGVNIAVLPYYSGYEYGAQFNLMF